MARSFSACQLLNFMSIFSPAKKTHLGAGPVLFLPSLSLIGFSEPFLMLNKTGITFAIEPTCWRWPNGPPEGRHQPRTDGN